MTKRNRHSNPRRGKSARLHLEALETRDTPAAVGSLDPSFDTDGKLATNFGGNDRASAVAIQTDGKIVVVGSTSSNNDFAIARYNPDGSLDTAFGGGDGKFTFTFGGVDIASDVAIQSDGKIVMVGHTDQGGGTADNFAIARVLADGSALDASFDTDGKVIVDFGSDDEATAVAIRPDGRIVVGGFTDSNNDFAVVQLTTTGALDTVGFGGGDGKFTTTFGGVDIATDLVIQSDGNIVMVGRTDQGGGTADNFAITRILADGSARDNSFDTDGRATIDFGGDDEANGVALQSDGRIVVAGFTTDNNDFAIARLNTNGSLDNTFDTDGKVTPTFGGTDKGASVAIQPDGKIVVAGVTNQGGGVADNFAILRVNRDGSFDNSFDTDGKATVDFGGDDEATSIALDPNGRMVVAGFTGAASDFAVARLIGTVEKGRNLAVTGSTDSKATLYAPDPATGQYQAVPVATLNPFDVAGANARAAVGDVNGDHVEDIIMVTGPDTAIRVAVVSGVDNTTLLVSPFDPFGGNFQGGGFVTVADFDLDGRAEFVITPDRGGGPRISIFSLNPNGSLATRANFITIEANFRGGCRPGAGDINGDGVPDLAVSAGFLGGPRIVLLDGKKLFTTDGLNPADKLVNDFFAFSELLRNGAYVAVGDVNGDGFGDLIFGAGPGGGPEIRIASGQTLMTTGSAAALSGAIADFFLAGDLLNRGGVRVATKDVDGDNKADVAVGTGGNQASLVRVYRGSDFTAITEPAVFQDINTFLGAVLADGVYVG